MLRLGLLGSRQLRSILQQLCRSRIVFFSAFRISKIFQFRVVSVGISRVADRLQILFFRVSTAYGLESLLSRSLVSFVLRFALLACGLLLLKRFLLGHLLGQNILPVEPLMNGLVWHSSAPLGTLHGQ